MYNLCFAIPYYNHPESIAKLTKILESYQFRIIIVDDGSNEVSKKAIENLNALILTHKINVGKGAAVKTAMIWALENNFTHIFQIDAYMQHDICGYGKYDNSIPKSRLYGRKITDFWVYINTLGGNFKDVMTGIRIYPLSRKIIDKTKSNRMDFDIGVLINYYKLKYEILWVEVGVKYGVPSHFRSFMDNVLIGIMHTKSFLKLPFYIYARIKNDK